MRITFANPSQPKTGVAVILATEGGKVTHSANKLDKQTKLSYQLLSQKLEQQIADYQWRHHNYPVNQMFGVHSQIPALLINMSIVVFFSSCPKWSTCSWTLTSRPWTWISPAMVDNSPGAMGFRQVAITVQPLAPY